MRFSNLYNLVVDEYKQMEIYIYNFPKQLGTFLDDSSLIL